MKRINNNLILGYIPPSFNEENLLLVFVENQIYDLIKDLKNSTPSGDQVVIKSQDDYDSLGPDLKVFSKHGKNSIHLFSDLDSIEEDNKSLIRFYDMVYKDIK